MPCISNPATYICWGTGILWIILSFLVARGGDLSHRTCLHCIDTRHCSAGPVHLYSSLSSKDFLGDIFHLLIYFICKRPVPSNENNELMTGGIWFSFWLCGDIKYVVYILYSTVSPSLSDDFNHSSSASQECSWWALINIFKVFWAPYLCTLISTWNMIRFQKQWLSQRLIITILIVCWILWHLLAACMSDIMVYTCTCLEEKSFWLKSFFLSIFTYNV